MSPFLVTDAARPMLSAPVTRLSPKSTFSCLLVVALILTFQSRNIGITAVATSHRQESAKPNERPYEENIFEDVVESLTGVDSVRDDQKIGGKTFRIWDVFPTGSERPARNAKSDARVKSHEEIDSKCQIYGGLLPFLVRRK